MQPGPRVYTFFLYLSDVEEGGGTKFDVGFTVQPKAGKAIWWPATLASDPFVSDDRTHHEALPVTKGVKYGANFWIHQVRRSPAAPDSLRCFPPHASSHLL